MNIIFVFLSNPYMTQPSKCAASALTLDVWMKSPGGKVLLIHCEASSLILAIGTSTSVNLCNLCWKLSKPVTRPWKTACLLGEGIAFKLHRITSMKGPVYSSALNARQLVPYVLRWGRWGIVEHCSQHGQGWLTSNSGAHFRLLQQMSPTVFGFLFTRVVLEKIKFCADFGSAEAATRYLPARTSGVLRII